MGLRDWTKPLAIGAPAPYIELPVKIERAIHFLPGHNKKIMDDAPKMLSLDNPDRPDVALVNMEDAVPFDAKAAAREGAAKAIREIPGDWWVRVNSFDSPFIREDLKEVVKAAGDPNAKGKLAVIMIPKIESPADIHFIDREIALLEAEYGVKAKQGQILVHPILETAKGVKNVDKIAEASPRLHGMSLGPADLAASRGMKTTRVGGGHPDYAVIADSPGPDVARALMMQDPWHYTVAKMVDACKAAGIKPFYGPFGDIKDTDACRQQFMNAFLLGCDGAWSLHPDQIKIAHEVFSPKPEEVHFALKIMQALPNGTGAVMIDGKMQDDATWKQAFVLVSLAEQIAKKDSALGRLYFGEKGLRALQEGKPLPQLMPPTPR